MPDLPVRFNPARIIEYKKRILPYFQGRRKGEATLLAHEEATTPRIAFAALLAFLFFSYAQPVFWLPGHPNFFTGSGASGVAWIAAKMRLSMSSAMIALISLIFYKSSRGEPFLFTKPQTQFLALFLGWGVMTVFFSLHPTKSWEFMTSDLLKVFLLFLIVMNVVRNARSFKALLWAVALCGAIPATGALLANINPARFAFYTPSGAGDRLGWTGRFSNPNMVALTMCMLIPVALSLIELSTSFAKKAFAFSLIGLYGFVMLKMLSRMAMLSLASIALVYILSSKKKVRNILVAAALALAGTQMVPGAMRRAKTITTYKQDPSAMGRLYLWKAGVKMAVASPLWGVGVDCFNIATANYFPAYGEKRALRWMSPHSSYIQVMAEMGFPGVAFFLGLVGIGLLDARRVHKRLAKHPHPEAQELAKMGRVIFLALAALSLVGLTGNHAYDWTLHMFIALTACLKQMARRHEVQI